MICIYIAGENIEYLSNALYFMKYLYVLSFLVCSSTTVLANNDSIPLEKGKQTSGGVRRFPSSKSSRHNLPLMERPFNSLPIETKRLDMPNPQPQEMPRTHSLSTEGRTVEEDIANPWRYTPTRRHLNRWYRNISGFRAFLDQGVTVGLGNNYNIRADWYGTFGYQFNPIYYVGIGQGFSLSLNGQESSAPSFVNARVNFIDENTTPFLDLKAGYSFVEGKGVYLNPNIGLSFGKNKRAWNISAGYSFQRADVTRKGIKYNYKYHGVVLKVSYEFSVFK